MNTMDAILPAIAKAMGAVKKVAKDSRNVEQKYDFASVDDFLAMVNPICAENGLMIQMDETACDDFTRAGKYGDTHWLRIAFSLTLMHVSGQSLPPVARTVEVIRTGAQSFGSAQSYVLKQYLRALFLIATGDKDDADYAEKGDGPVNRPEPRRADPEPAFNPEAAATRIAAALGRAESLDDLRDTWKREWPTIQLVEAASTIDSARIHSGKEARKAALSAPTHPPVNADLGGDALPY